jgi:hypothetical protein
MILIVVFIAHSHIHSSNELVQLALPSDFPKYSNNIPPKTRFIPLFPLHTQNTCSQIPKSSFHLFFHLVSPPVFSSEVCRHVYRQKAGHGNDANEDCMALDVSDFH